MLNMTIESHGESTLTNTNNSEQTTQNAAKQNYPGSRDSYDTRPGNAPGPAHTINYSAVASDKQKSIKSNK